MQTLGLNSGALPRELSLSDQKWLCRLSRSALEQCVLGHAPPAAHPEDFPDRVREPGASFVTLRREGKLRGCIGNIIGREPLYLSIIHNTEGAALRDTRFESVVPQELSDIRIELSVLTAPQPVQFQNPEELIITLRETRPGVVFRLGGRMSTFLPQVWEMLPEAESFLQQLSRKAGFDLNAWMRRDAEFQLYYCQKITEQIICDCREPGLPSP